MRTLWQINKEYFASVSFDNTIKIWEINTWKCFLTLEAHNQNIIGIISFNMRDNKMIVSCSNDKTVKVWESEYEQDEGK